MIGAATARSAAVLSRMKRGGAYPSGVDPRAWRIVAALRRSSGRAGVWSDRRRSTAPYERAPRVALEDLGTASAEQRRITGDDRRNVGRDESGDNQRSRRSYARHDLRRQRDEYVTEDV